MKDEQRRGLAPSRIFLAGDSQAQAILQLLKGTREVSTPFEIQYVEGLAEIDEASLHGGDTIFEQVTEPRSVSSKHLGKASIFRFPRLHFDLQWPLNAQNPYNRPDPPSFPNGPFPYGDGFIISSFGAETPAGLILRFYNSIDWAAAWPRLDQLYASEEARLLELDAGSDVRIGRYILNNFSRRKLFLNVHGPTDILLVELAYQLLSVAFRGSIGVTREDLNSTSRLLGSRDIFGSLEVPIHRTVASTFELSWYRSDASYNYFDLERLSHDEYFTKFISYVSGSSLKLDSRSNLS